MAGVLVGALVSLAVGCRRGDTRPPAVADPLALLPVEAQLVAFVDLARARQAPVAAQLATLRPLLAAPLAAIQAFTAKTGFDPWRSVDSVTLGVSGSAPDRWGVVVRGALLDEARAEAYARELLAGQGTELVATKRGPLTLWSPRNDPGTAAFFADPHTWVVGVGGWGDKMADLARGAPADESATTNAALAKLSARVRQHPLWTAVVATDQTRRILDGQPTLRGVSGATLTVALDQGLAADLTASLPSAEAADAAAEVVASWLVAQRRRTELEPLLKGMTAFVTGTDLRVGLAIDGRLATTIGDMAAQLYGLARPRLPALVGTGPRSVKFSATETQRWSGRVAVGAIHTFNRMGDSFAMMEVANRTTKPIVPQVVVGYLDPEGHSIARETCLMPTVVVLPRERMPCLIPVPPDAASAGYTVDLLPDGKAAQLAGAVRPDLKILGARLESPPGPRQIVVGEVVNGTRASQRVRVQASFYDSSRVLVGTSVAEVAHPIGPGAKAPFEVSVTMLPSQAKSFTATAFAVPSGLP